MSRAVVVLSGGQDSTTCLYWAVDRWGAANVHSVTFDYGQRHRIELDCAARVADMASVPNTVLPIDTFRALGGDALTDRGIDVQPGNDAETGLPNTFVPGRNLVFLTYAAALGYRLGAPHLVTGVAQTDYSGYPDCRADTLEALETAITCGMEFDVTIHAPLMDKNKKQTVELAVQLGAMDAMAWTHTCYNGAQPPCGVCPACELRAKGFFQAGIADPLVARLAAAG